jgi:hypothetical protein
VVLPSGHRICSLSSCHAKKLGLRSLALHRGHSPIAHEVASAERRKVVFVQPRPRHALNIAAQDRLGFENVSEIEYVTDPILLSVREFAQLRTILNNRVHDRDGVGIMSEIDYVTDLMHGVHELPRRRQGRWKRTLYKVNILAHPFNLSNTSSFPLRPAPKVRKIRFKCSATAGNAFSATCHSEGQF